MRGMSPPLFLLGATAVGKSAVALELARARGAAILALDAMQVYRGANIGVGKPTAAERAEIPHGGLDLAEFGETFDVARYVEHAAAFLAEQHAAGRPVMVVGGTGLYFRALTRGLCDAPPTPVGSARRVGHDVAREAARAAGAGRRADARSGWRRTIRGGWRAPSR